MDAKKEIALQGRRLLPGPVVQAKTSLSRVTIWRMCRQNEFPAPVRISPNRIAWDADAVEAWIAARVGTGGQAAA